MNAAALQGPRPSWAQPWPWALALIGLLAWHGGLHAWQVLGASACIVVLAGWASEARWLSARELGIFGLLVLWQLGSSLRPQLSLDQLFWALSLVVWARCLLRVERPAAHGGTKLFFALGVLASLAVFACAAWLRAQEPQKVWQGTSLVASATHLFFPNQNLLAVGVLVPAFVVGLGWLLQGPAWTWALPGLVLLTAAMVTLGSRGGLLALAAAGAWWCLRAWRSVDRGWRRWACALLWALAVLAVWRIPGTGLQKRASDDAKASTQDPFRYQRLKFWKVSLKASLERPWMGWGQGAYAEAMLRQDTGAELSERNPIGRYRLLLEHAHNEVLEIAVEWGWPLTLVLIGMVVCWAWRRAWRAEADVNAWAAEAFLVGIAVHAMVDMPLRPAFMQMSIVTAWAYLESGEPHRSPAAAFAGPLRAMLAFALIFALGAWLKVDLRQRQGAAASTRTLSLAQALQPFDVDGAVASGAKPSAWWDLWSRDDLAWLQYTRQLDPARRVALRPYSAPAWLELALARRGEGKPAEAQAALDRALALEPNFVRAWQWQALGSTGGRRRLALQQVARIEHLTIPEDQKNDAVVHALLSVDPALPRP